MEKEGYDRKTSHLVDRCTSVCVAQLLSLSLSSLLFSLLNPALIYRFNRQPFRTWRLKVLVVRALSDCLDNLVWSFRRFVPLPYAVPYNCQQCLGPRLIQPIFWRFSKSPVSRSKHPSSSVEIQKNLQREVLSCVEILSKEKRSPSTHDKGSLVDHAPHLV